MKIALVTHNNNKFLQAKTMYDSLDIDYIYTTLHREFDIELLTHSELNLTAQARFDIIIYSTSQVLNYKQYVQTTLYNFQADSHLIPSYQCLLAHENKAYEYSLLEHIGLSTLKFKHYTSKIDYLSDNIDYPLVLKTPHGSSSRGVKICTSERQAKAFINKVRNRQLLAELIMTPPIQWFHHIRELKAEASFITQQYIANYEGDYRVQVIGNKFFIYYRKLKRSRKYTSGNGSINIYDLHNIDHILDAARAFAHKIYSPHIIFDIVESNGIHILEFSAIHTSNVAIDSCDVYYTYDNRWIKNANNQKREDYYIDGYREAINSFSINRCL